MKRELATKYDPSAEAEWYRHWEQSGHFRATVRPEKKSFCITIPPPNVTGELHMGHAIQHAIHDNIIRRRRMQGFEALCLPGTDHAGIATQMQVEKRLADGQTRYDLGRAELLKRVWDWRQKYGDTIYSQLRKLGCSYDWERSRFTLDDDYVEAVLLAFTRFHEHGWIYRGTRMINWCPACRTVISDLETEERVLQGHLWHIRYPGVDGCRDVVVATTRPETMLGDSGVAVHPADERWRDAVGKRVRLPLMERELTIVADDYADPEIGSGAVKVTPAHDPNDYEIGRRHGLSEIVVIGFDAVMTAAAGPYAGQERYECRRNVVAALESAGLLTQVEDHEHAVPHHDKCGTVIEPLPMEQWFMDMKGLAAKTRPHLESGDIEYVPDRFRQYAIDWLDGIRDWALSRQIWWGHRIPAWYCVHCSGGGLVPLGGLPRDEALAEGSFRVSLEAGAQAVVQIGKPESCVHCGGDEFVQDPDVLDTWFSSALWPFATLGWPQRDDELRYFYPTDVMITGRDILYLWVLRMAMTSVEFIQKIPFRTVLVHPTVLTKDGRRMSKSLGTGLNPLDLVRLYGADATRFSLLHQAGAMQDVRFDAEISDNQVQSSQSARSGQAFCNKLWNAARFVLMNLEGFEPPRDISESEADLADQADLADRWIRSSLATAIQKVDEHQDAFRFSDVARTLYGFLWNDYCDWYVELAKVRLNGAPEERATAQSVLVEILEQALRLMHPVMPFITEALWQALPGSEGRADSIMIAPWPTARSERIDPSAVAEMGLLQEVISAVRNIRSELNVPHSAKLDVVLSGSPDSSRLLASHASYLQALAQASDIQVGCGLAKPPGSSSAVVRDVEVHVPLAGLIDVEAESKRLQKEIDKFSKLLRALDGKLRQQKFLERAPAEVVERERQRQSDYRENLGKLEANLASLTN